MNPLSLQPPCKLSKTIHNFGLTASYTVKPVLYRTIYFQTVTDKVRRLILNTFNIRHKVEIGKELFS